MVADSEYCGLVGVIRFIAFSFMKAVIDIEVLGDEVSKLGAGEGFGVGASTC